MKCEEHLILTEVNEEDIQEGVFVIPDGVTKIGKHAFSKANKVEKL